MDLELWNPGSQLELSNQQLEGLWGWVRIRGRLVVT